MRTFAQKSNATLRPKSDKLTISDRGYSGKSNEVKSILQLQRTAGNQAVQRMLQPNATIPIQRKMDAAPAPNARQDVESQISGLKSGGQPLPRSLRDFFEPRFGHDFSRVRIHSDARAAESARNLQASAFTAGRDIVFGEGQYAVENPETRRLLAHELTHVVQQQSSPVPIAPGVSDPGDFHERQAVAVADALMCGGHVVGLLDSGSGAAPHSVQRDTPKAGQPAQAAPTPMDYDRNLKLLQPVPQGLTLADVTKILKDAVKKGDIKSFAVSGVNKGSNAEIFLLALLAVLGTTPRWHTEADIVAPIDWAPKGGGAAPVGRVTVRIDAQGNATAELIAAGPVPAVGQLSIADGTTKLTTDFGFASVSGWSGKDPKKDAAEISDVVAALELLKKVSPKDIPALKGVDLMRVPSLSKDRAGEFWAGELVSLGGKTDTNAWLKLADKAFSGDKVQFAGGGPGSPTVPSSFQTILHEVGHAVEQEELRGARAEHEKAFKEVEAAKKASKDDGASYDEELKKAQAKGKRAVDEFYKKRAASYKKGQEAEEVASKHLTEADTRLKDTRDPTSKLTKRLQKFVDLVNSKNIHRFTKYAADNWPGNPEEFYAEAYSLWLVDSNFLKTNYKDVYDFFENGDYRKS